MSLDDVASRSRPAIANVYTWEPPDRVIAATLRPRRPRTILRFDLNTSPRRTRRSSPRSSAGPFDPPLNEYPDSTYAALAEAAADYVGATACGDPRGRGRGRGPRHHRQDVPAAGGRRPSCRSPPTRCTGC